MKHKAIVKLALFAIVIMLFTGCIITDGYLNAISLSVVAVDDQETNVFKIDEENDILYVVAGKSIDITATGVDSYGTKLPGLSDPDWVYDEKSIGNFKKLNRSTILFTASKNVGAEGELIVSITQYETDIEETDIEETVVVVITIEVVDELPTDELDEE